MKTRIGIIGVGGVARYAHLPAYMRNGIFVECLCDTNKKIVHEIGNQFGIKKVYHSTEEMLADCSVDIIDIATPPATHINLLKICAQYHKKVLVQKPIIVSHDQLDQLSSLIQQLPALRVNLQGRYVSAWQKVKQVINNGSIGNPLFCTIINQDWWDRSPSRWDFNVDNYIVYEMLVHHVDLCIYWFGYPHKVTARGGINPQQNMRKTNFISVMLEYESGLIVQIVDNWCMSEYKFATGHPFEEVLITCSNGVVKANSESVECSKSNTNSIDTYLLPRPGQTLPYETLEKNWFFDAFGEIMNDFIIQGQSPEVVRQDKEYALYITKLLFSVSQSLKQDNWIIL